MANGVLNEAELKARLERLENKLWECECAERMDWGEYEAVKAEIKAVNEELSKL